MRNAEYYEALKKLAREKREFYNVNTLAFGIREAKAVFKAEKVRIDYWPLPWKIKALYMCEDGDCSVAIQKNLPDEPKLFALIHELKHHYCDRESMINEIISCGDYNANELTEIGAEMFAAEFIFPEADFADHIKSLGIVNWKESNVVHLKRNCRAKISYTYICKRLEHLGLISPGQFKSVQFKKLEEQMFGVPFYRR